MALPWFESLAVSQPLSSAKPPLRLAYLYVPNGVHMQEWTPASVGRDFELPPLLARLERFRSQFTVLSGLTADKARANGDGPGDHARAAAAFLTGVQPSKSDVQLGISADQIAANHVGSQTRLRSLEIGCEAGRQAGQCDSGYSCAYSSNISWQGAKTPALKETSPRSVFDRLLGRDLVPEDPDEAKRRSSILDLVRGDAKRLGKKLGQQDKEKLDEYLTGVRELERRIEHAMSGELEGVGAAERPKRHKNYEEHIRLMFDLLVLAFQTDSTRIATFMLANEGSNRSYKNLEVAEGHHSLSHHGGNEEKIRQIKLINGFHLDQFAYFLDKMQSIEEGKGSLLDHSMIVYGSGISDGNRHNHDELPILLAGSGGGSLEPGQHIRVEAERPLNDLHLALLERMGVEVDSFGDARETLAL